MEKKEIPPNNTNSYREDLSFRTGEKKGRRNNIREKFSSKEELELFCKKIGMNGNVKQFSLFVFKTSLGDSEDKRFRKDRQTFEQALSVFTGIRGVEFLPNLDYIISEAQKNNPLESIKQLVRGVIDKFKHWIEEARGDEKKKRQSVKDLGEAK